MRHSTETQKAISEQNRLSILRFIRDAGETTRFDVASHLHLSHTTVKTYVESLLADGLIEEAGTAPSMGGRKPVIIRLVPDSRVSFGVNFAPGRIDLLVLNLKRDILVQKTLPFDVDSDFSAVLDHLAETIEQVIRDFRIDRDKILGLGMTFPGLVDDEEDRLVYLANLKVKDYSLKPFAEKIGLRIFAENEAQAAANAERVLGHAENKDNLVYVSIAEGIGAGILINGRIYRAHGKNAGEFGHVRISDKPVPCNCGRTGCWERFASSQALIRDYAAQSKDADATLDELFARYRAGDETAVRVLETYTRNLFKGIDIILLAYSPDDVIIGGDLANYAQDIIDLATGKLGLTQAFPGYENTSIQGPGLKDSAALMGAALLPMERDAFAGELSPGISQI